MAATPGHDPRPAGIEATEAVFQHFLDRLQDEPAPLPEQVNEVTDGWSAIPGAVRSGQLASLFQRLRIRGQLASRYDHGEKADREIGRGAMGHVLKTRDLELGRTVAMKVLTDPAALPDLVERFVDEAQVMGQLDHPGIVAVHELGVDEMGRPFFTMPLVRGRDLQAILNEGGEDWSVQRGLQVLLRVCEAIAFAHDRSVLHRDLKPANIMVGRFGEVYVMDWGLAKILGAAGRADGGADETSSQTLISSQRSTTEDPAATVAGTVLGTPSYMSPEQARGDLEHLDQRSDVYSLGAILYHVLSGRAPYADTCTDALAVLTHACEAPPTPLRVVASDAAPELVAIAEKAMARDPAERYPDAVELASDLQSFLDGRVVSAVGSGALLELRKWVGRNRMVATLGASLVLALAVGLAVSLGLLAEKRRGARDLGLSSIAWHRARAEQLAREADELWPGSEDATARLEAWLASAAELRADVEQLVRTLSEDGVEDPRLAELEALDAELASWHDPIEGRVFASDPVHGPSIRERLRVARESEWLSQESPEAEAAWHRAIEAIADPRVTPAYGGLQLSAQSGLVPLGPDPRTGLWEFACTRTGVPATRDAESREIRLEEQHGLVFILVPRGVAWLGTSLEHGTRNENAGYVEEARSTLNAENFPGFASADGMRDVGLRRVRRESPVHAVALESFFLSKFEMNQAQWRRMTAANPSKYAAGVEAPGPRITALHPVENITWDAATRTLSRYGFELPTEAQWEYTSRAGTEGARWTGGGPESLEGKENVLDLSGVAAGLSGDPAPTFDDGWPFHAPVDVGAQNPFGFVHVLGNVMEWCRDAMGPYAGVVRGLDGVSTTTGPHRIQRGGSFAVTGPRARSARRDSKPPMDHSEAVGIRPFLRLSH